MKIIILLVNGQVNLFDLHDFRSHGRMCVCGSLRKWNREKWNEHRKPFHFGFSLCNVDYERLIFPLLWLRAHFMINRKGNMRSMVGVCEMCRELNSNSYFQRWSGVAQRASAVTTILCAKILYEVRSVVFETWKSTAVRVPLMRIIMQGEFRQLFRVSYRIC